MEFLITRRKQTKSRVESVKHDDWETRAWVEGFLWETDDGLICWWEVMMDVNECVCWGRSTVSRKVMTKLQYSHSRLQ